MKLIENDKKNNGLAIKTRSSLNKNCAQKNWQQQSSTVSFEENEQVQLKKYNQMTE